MGPAAGPKPAACRRLRNPAFPYPPLSVRPESWDHLELPGAVARLSGAVSAGSRAVWTGSGATRGGPP
eukprot:1487984-Pyramimonas_sp.AAC.1